MSDCGGIVVACLAAPLMILILLVAGVGAALLMAAEFAGHVALAGLDLAGKAIAPLVRSVTDALNSAGMLNLPMTVMAGSPLTSLDPLNVAELFRSHAHSFLAASETSCLARAVALERALADVKPLNLVASELFDPEVKSARNLMAEAAEHLDRGDAAGAERLGTAAEAAFARVGRQAAERLTAATRVTMTAQVGCALQDLGYAVRVASDPRRAAIVGRREHQSVALVVGEGGHIEVDMEGFDGAQCHADSQALIAGLRRRGLVISATNLTRHGSCAGGALIRAARRSGRTLEEALLGQAATMGTPAVTPQSNEPVVRSTRLDYGSRDSERDRTWVWGTPVARTGGRQ